MKSYVACALLLLVQLAAADQVININNGTDQALAVVNRQVTQRGLGVMHVPPILFEDVELLNGFFIGANSLVRTQNATLTRNETAVTVDLHVGRTLHEFVFGQIKVNGDEMTGVFNVKNNSIHISFTAVNRTGCFVSVNKYEYETLTDVTFKANLPQYGADVSDVFRNAVLPRINKEIGVRIPMVQQALQRAICRKHFVDLHEAAHLSEILTHVFIHI